MINYIYLLIHLGEYIYFLSFLFLSTCAKKETRVTYFHTSALFLVCIIWVNWNILYLRIHDESKHIYEDTVT